MRARLFYTQADGWLMHERRGVGGVGGGGGGGGVGGGGGGCGGGRGAS